MDMTEPEQQIETIRVQMQEIASFLTNEIVNPSQTALLTKREDISSHVSVMCDNLSKFRALLAEIGFDAAGRRSSTNKHVDDFMATYDAGMRKVQERIAKEEKIRIRNKGQLVPFQDPEEYMREYYRLHPHHQEEEEETELTRSVEEHIAMEERLYAAYLSGRRDHSSAGWTFKDKTTLSPMYFTHCMPNDLDHATGTSLQIFSVKIAGIKGDLKWPLYVYGLVAARDKVDFNRNILFDRTRKNAQKVTEDDPFLRLTGPARAILPELEFEVELMVKGRTKSRDRALINQAYPYIQRCSGLYTIDLHNCRCRIELSLEQLENSVQATILGVRIVKGGPCTFKYGDRVACSSPPHEVVIMDSQGSVLEVTDPPSTQVVLLDSRYCVGGEMPMGTDGYLDLTRRVVSVELRQSDIFYPEKLEETFKIVIQAYSKNGDVAAQGHVKLTPKLCNISQAVCDLGDSKVEITVAWSVHVESKMFL